MKFSDVFKHAGLALSAIALSSLALAPSVAAADTAAPTEKDETVYVYTNADGSVKNAEISTVLKNPDGAAELSDSSNLTDIKGEKDTTFSGSGSSIVWNADGKNVTYKGATASEAPVSIRVSYTLDGQPISPDQLAGKSGRITIRYDFENHSAVTATIRGTTQTIYTPFTCVTALMFDGKDFKNVTVENGKVINDGDDMIVAGFAMPGLKQSLGSMADNADVPDHFTVTADVTNFELKSTMTVVTAGILSELDSSSIGMGDLDDASALTDAMNTLIDGSGKLTTGLDALASGASQLSAGTNALTSGADSLSGGIYALAYGYGDTPGLTAARDGATALAGGLSQLSNSLAALANAETGLPAAAGALSTLSAEYADEASTVAAAQAELAALAEASGLPHDNIDKVLADASVMSATLAATAPGVEAASAGVYEAAAATATLSSNAQALPAGLSAAVDAAEILQVGAAELEAGAAQLEAAAQQLATSTQEAANGSKTLTQGMQTFNNEGVSRLVNVIENDYGGLLDRMNALSDAAKAYSNFGGITDGTTGTVKFVFETDAIKKQ